MIRHLFAAALLGSAALAQAAIVNPVYGTFGNLAGATFGGSGIPTNPTAISTNGNVTLGLTAFGRYCNAPLTNDGAGTFTAQPGTNNGLCVGSPQTVASTWNFGFYINVGTAPISNYTIDLFYDLDPAANTDSANMGRFDIDAIAAVSGGGSLIQGAENLSFGYLAAGIPGFVFAPGGSFNAMAGGEYGFLLRVTDGQGVVTESAILVNVAAIPEPASIALIGLALLGAAAARRRRQG